MCIFIFVYNIYLHIHVHMIHMTYMLYIINWMNTYYVNEWKTWQLTNQLTRVSWLVYTDCLWVRVLGRISLSPLLQTLIFHKCPFNFHLSPASLSTSHRLLLAPWLVDPLDILLLHQQRESRLECSALSQLWSQQGLIIFKGRRKIPLAELSEKFASKVCFLD